MKKHKTTLSAAVAVALCASPALAQAGEWADQFDSPVELTSNSKSIDVPYPSPTLYDVDGDGKKELVVGDLTGHIHSAAPAGGALLGELVKVTTADGEVLKLNNW